MTPSYFGYLLTQITFSPSKIYLIMVEYSSLNDFGGFTNKSCNFYLKYSSTSFTSELPCVTTSIKLSFRDSILFLNYAENLLISSTKFISLFCLISSSVTNNTSIDPFLDAWHTLCILIAFAIS